MKLTRSAKIAGSQDFYTHGFEVELEWGDIKDAFHEKKILSAVTKFYCLQWYSESLLYREVNDAGLLTVKQAQDWAKCCSEMHTRMVDALRLE